MANGKNNGFDLEEILKEQRMRERQSNQGHEDAYIENEPGGYGEYPEEEIQDINSYATGVIDVPIGDDEEDPEEEEYYYEEGYEEGYYEEEVEEKPKKEKRGLFGRKKKDKKKKSKRPNFNEEDEEYYGLQLKPIDEYQKGYDNNPESGINENTYTDLFMPSDDAIDDEVERNFEQLRKERRNRVSQAVRSVGADKDQLEEEFGVVAPMPVSSYAADPYSKQHGTGVGGQNTGDLPDFQKAQINSMKSNDQTMEIKLNVASDTMEIQKAGSAYRGEAVSGETISGVLKSAPKPDATPNVKETAGSRRQDNLIPNREPQEIPEVSSIYEYRAKGIPVHVINANVMQDAILTESEKIEAESRKAMEKAARESAKEAKRAAAKSSHIQEQRRERAEADRPRAASGSAAGAVSGSEPVRFTIGIDEEEAPKVNTRVSRKQSFEQDVPEDTSYIDEEQESIDDYTSPADAKSVSNELRKDMHELSLRMMITGICMAALVLINIIFGSMFGGEKVGNPPIIYSVLTLIFTLISIGICRKPLLSGLKSLFEFAPNSNSGLAAASVGVLVQTVAGLFFPADISNGTMHMYAVVLAGLLLVSTMGNLTMVRRIHSNFRFITSREDKFAVRTYDDYNTALKMTREAVAEKPLIAYQCPTGFLKRFLENSYVADPAELASLRFAPIGVIASLLVCLVCLIITSSVPAALSALAAALLASVAVGNMLAVNLPMSRLTKTARRAGAMVVGYEGVEALGNVNAVLVDASEIFPRGTVVLEGIKTYQSRDSVQRAVLAASVLVRSIGGPLEGVFEQVINENEDLLPEVENFNYIDGNGMAGTVDGDKVFVGNRNMLINNQIEPPPREDELEFSNGNKQTLYIAVNGELAAMMILTYSADRRRKNEIQRLEDSGVSIVVRTTDPNVKAKLLSKLFEVDKASVSILNSDLGEIAGKLTHKEVPRADALVATKGRMESLMSVVSMCVNAKRQTGFIIILQTIAIVLGFLLVALLACFGAIGRLTSFVLFVFELISLIAIILIPRIKRN